MAGIYIHIPFCLQRCHYCDFYSCTQLELEKQFVDACTEEIVKRRSYLGEEEVNSIYFGGGTPSVLDPDSLAIILNSIFNNFHISQDSEISIEVNPDDVSLAKIQLLRSMGFNRISMGIQSFNDDDLLMMNRRHNAKEALKAIDLTAKAGFNNVSIDFIYGIPGSTQKSWFKNISTVKDLNVSHLSAYHLTFEPGTKFHTWLKKGRFKELDDEDSYQQYHVLLEESSRYGFEQYEISNFARNMQYSRHNMKYWNGEKYLGLGPSAHSYQGSARHWNEKSIHTYIKHGIEKRFIAEEEILDDKNRRNELLMTRLRTKWGIAKNDWVMNVPHQSWDEILSMAAKYIETGDMKLQNDHLLITPASWFRADGMIADLFEI